MILLCKSNKDNRNKVCRVGTIILKVYENNYIRKIIFDNLFSKIYKCIQILSGAMNSPIDFTMISVFFVCL